MRNTLWLLFLLVALALMAVEPSAPAAPARPNFIVVLGEGAGWTTTSVQMDDRNPASKGEGFKTPNLERLAKAGLRFSDGYAASPRCTPSRAALFTGRSPAALHMTFIGDGRGGNDADVKTKLIPPHALLELPATETTIAELLKRAGYATAHFGKWHVGRVDPAQHGFDESDGATGNGGPDNVANPNPKQALAMTAHGIAFMEKQVKAGKPFYLQMSHYPSQEEKGGGGGGKGKGDAHQQEEMNVVDQTFGQMLDAVERLGLKGSTYIVYTTDHGTPGRNPPLAGGKGGVWEGGLRVPFMVAGPGIKAGACSHVRVSATDLLPTFAELAALSEPLPQNLEGGSFASVLLHGGEGTVKRPREEFVAHFPHYDKDRLGPASALLLGDYKLIRVYEDNSLMLFNLAQDPGERNNLAKQMPEKATELNQRLTDYLARVQAQMPTTNPHPDASASAGSMPGEKRGKRGGGGKGGKGGRSAP